MRVFCYFLSFYICIPVNAQESNINGVAVGDQIPEISIAHVSNFKNKTFQLSDFKGKLVIIDFWGINCAPCIKAFPHLQMLQSKFSNSLQIILVNAASKTWLDSIVRIRKQTIRDFALPDLVSVNQDTVLSRLFPHQTIPHYVWISPGGTVIAITDNEAVNEEAIRATLTNVSYKLTEKKDLLTFNSSKPLLPQVLGNIDMKYYSILANSIDGLWGASMRLNIDSTNKISRITRANATILALVGEAATFLKIFDPFNSADFDFGKRVIIRVKDSSKFFYLPSSLVSYKDWKKSHSYCYEMISPFTDTNQICQTYLEDVKRFFNLDVTIQLRTMKCLAIIRNSNADKIKYQGSERRVFTDTNGVFYLTGLGRGLSLLRTEISRKNKDSLFCIVDNTGYSGKVKIELHSSLSDISALKKELQMKYDLDLVETKQKVPVLIISEKNN